MPGIELQFLGRLVSNLVVILTDLPQTLSVDTKLCIIIRIHFLENRTFFSLSLSGEKMGFRQNVGGVQKWVLLLLPRGKAAGV